jgi:glycosyltransferase involved in cell wall biosynthesis
MKIAIVTQGRFHAFDLAKAVLKRGHEVTLFTNYPLWAAKKFGLPGNSVRSFWPHAVLCRLIYKFSNGGLRYDASSFLNPIFGRWVAKEIAKRDYDVVHSFSSIAVEWLENCRAKFPGGGAPANLVVRGSAHIETQDDLLREEELRAKRRIERPGQRIVDREKREYQLADRVVILSTFAYNTFLDRGIHKYKLALLPLGVNVDHFRASEEALEERRRRISSGAPLRVLWVGTMSLRKGLLDYVEMIKALAGPKFQFRFVGDLPAGLASLIAEVKDTVEFVPRQPQWELRRQYEWGDVFVFPTLEDGFAVVLAQAAANALPILATTNCAAPDMLRDGKTGWVLPIRSPQAFIDRLRWCEANREALAAMVLHMSNDFVPRTWDDVAADFEAICRKAVQGLAGESTKAQTAGQTGVRT